MQMILPTTLLLGALGYFFYTSKKEISLDNHNPIDNQKENDDLYEVKQEAFDLQTYKKFLSFLKFQEMMEKYNN